MARTFFHDDETDAGIPVTVEYQVGSEGEPHFDFPGHICDGGGSGPEISIVSVLTEGIVLTDAERERIEMKIAEEHEPDYDYDDYY